MTTKVCRWIFVSFPTSSNTSTYFFIESMNLDRPYLARSCVPFCTSNTSSPPIWISPRWWRKDFFKFSVSRNSVKLDVFGYPLCVSAKPDASTTVALFCYVGILVSHIRRTHHDEMTYFLNAIAHSLRAQWPEIFSVGEFNLSTITVFVPENHVLFPCVCFQGLCNWRWTKWDGGIDFDLRIPGSFVQSQIRLELDQTKTGWTCVIKRSEVDILDRDDYRPSFANYHRWASSDISAVEKNRDFDIVPCLCDRPKW